MANQPNTAYAPALWNDRGTPLRPPLPSPSELLSGAGSDLIGQGIDALATTVQAQLLAREGNERIRAVALRDRVPIPAPEDREGYFGERHFSYWLSGLGDALLLRDLAADLGSPGRLLDFGCSSGRVLRHVHTVMPDTVAHGVDLGMHNVRWMRQYLPHITVALSTTLPTLPFPDGYFGAIYAGSVFTHIADFEEAWLLELRRILAPGGWALLTFHPERIWKDGLRRSDHPTRKRVTTGRWRVDPPGVEPVPPELFAQPMPGERVVFTNLTWPVNNTVLIHSHNWITRRWGAILPLRRIIEQAHGGHQDAAVLVATPVD